MRPSARACGRACSRPTATTRATSATPRRRARSRSSCWSARPPHERARAGRMSAQGLGRLVDLALQLEADAQRPAAELRRRDRALGRELSGAGLRGDAWVEAWLERVRPPAPEGAGARSARALRGLSALLAGFGITLGSGAAAALFHYDGTHPVNVVR